MIAVVFVLSLVVLFVSLRISPLAPTPPPFAPNPPRRNLSTKPPVIAARAVHTARARIGRSLVSRAGAGVKGDKVRQFFAINGRPVELPRAVRVLNETYK